MDVKEVIHELRLKKGLSQDELADKVHVTRQAVSRWETGETVPNIETLKLLSKLFDVSINTLIGSPREMICHCCGMSLDDASTSKDVEGDFEEAYCNFCYPTEGTTDDFWKRYVDLGGEVAFDQFKKVLIDEFNQLNVVGLPKVEELNLLPGSFVNLEYTLPNGMMVKLLDDEATYFGNQLPCEFGGERCFGIVASSDFLLVCTYEENGENPELELYKKR